MGGKQNSRMDTAQSWKKLDDEAIEKENSKQKFTL